MITDYYYNDDFINSITIIAILLILQLYYDSYISE